MNKEILKIESELRKLKKSISDIEQSIQDLDSIMTHLIEEAVTEEDDFMSDDEANELIDQMHKEREEKQFEQKFNSIFADDAVTFTLDDLYNPFGAKRKISWR